MHTISHDNDGMYVNWRMLFAAHIIYKCQQIQKKSIQKRERDQLYCPNEKTRHSLKIYM
jgi:hypothetical protein